MGTTKGLAYDDKFLEFIVLFAKIGTDTRIFPKKCRTCSKVYQSFPDYIRRTSAAKHCLEDYRAVSDGYGTMQYRNCSCGTTLMINFSKDVYPLIDRFWEMIGKESKATGKAVREVVEEFREQCNRYVLEHGER